MPRIFISYRHNDDTEAITGRIHDRLANEFGSKNVFLDVIPGHIPYGADFRKILQNNVNQCDVMLVIIGKRWLNIREDDDPALRRLDNPEDFVRNEVHLGLERYRAKRTLVIPVLVKDAQMPTELDLPEPLKELAFLNAPRLRGNHDFHKEMTELVSEIRSAFPVKRRFGLMMLLGIAIFAVFAALIYGRNVLLKNPAPTDISSTSPDTSLTLTAGLQSPNPIYTLRPSATSIPTINRQSTTDANATQLVITNLTQTAVAISTRVASGGLTRNRDWNPIIQSVNGADMVLVPAGCFDMGSSDQQLDYAMTIFSGSGREFYVGEQPVQQQCFDKPFWIDYTEVTNIQFNQFNGVAAKPGKWTYPDHPRNNLTWGEARNYCILRGGRLPTESEWEYAARGPDDLIYPWGNEFVADNVADTRLAGNQTVAVGSRPAGKSWVGALDMSGNVWEWVSSIYDDYPYDAKDGRERDEKNGFVRHVLRGGSWLTDDIYNLRTTSRNGQYSISQSDLIGVRCARDYDD